MARSLNSRALGLSVGRGDSQSTTPFNLRLVHPPFLSQPHRYPANRHFRSFRAAVEVKPTLPRGRRATSRGCFRGESRAATPQCRASPSVPRPETTRERKRGGKTRTRQRDRPGVVGWGVPQDHNTREFNDMRGELSVGDWDGGGAGLYVRATTIRSTRECPTCILFKK